MLKRVLLEPATGVTAVTGMAPPGPVRLTWFGEKVAGSTASLKVTWMLLTDPGRVLLPVGVLAVIFAPTTVNWAAYWSPSGAIPFSPGMPLWFWSIGLPLRSRMLGPMTT